MKMYRIETSSIDVKEFEVVKETEKQITYLLTYIGSEKQFERREAKQSSYSKWFKTKPEAVLYLINRTQKQINFLEKELTLEKSNLEQLNRELK